MNGGDLIAVVAAAISLAAAAVAWSQARKTTLLNTYAATTGMMVQMDQVIVANPALRRYFSGGTGCGPEDPRDEEILAVSEMFLDILEAIWASRDGMKRKERASWRDYIEGMFRTAPALRGLYRERLNDDWYPYLRDALSGTPYGAGFVADRTPESKAPPS